MFKSLTRKEFLTTTSGLLFFGPEILGSLNTTTYVVRKGDTLSKIALSHGVSVGELKRVNGMRGDLIIIDQQLKIPTMAKSSEYLAEVRDVTESISLKARKWQYIVGHHSAIASGNAAIYDKNHRRRGMTNGLAYHFVIGNGIDSGNGEIEVGNRWLKQLDGGHVRKAKVNHHGIGICVVGNFEESRPTRHQIRAFIELVDYLGTNVIGSTYKFLVHREVDKNHTVCPGKYFPVQAMHRRFN